MSQGISLELSCIVGQKSRGRFRRKHVRFFTLHRMTSEQYATAGEMLIAAVQGVGQQLMDAGYDMTFQGKPISEICD